MNVTTLSGVYENARVVLRVLGGGQSNTLELMRRLAMLSQDAPAAEKLALALTSLESHIRVLGVEDVKLENTSRI